VWNGNKIDTQKEILIRKKIFQKFLSQEIFFKQEIFLGRQKVFCEEEEFLFQKKVLIAQVFSFSGQKR